jgi:endo-1,4-beta-D-glucanase Y
LLIAAVVLSGGGGGACARPPGDWDAFKTTYVMADGRVVDPENGGVSHSEGQGWTMLLAEAHGDRQTFDHAWAWTQANLARQKAPLLAWRYDPKTNPAVADENILVAWALLRAGRRWGDEGYLAASSRLRAAIAERLVVELGGRTLLLPGEDGFRGPAGVTTNPSYFILPAFQDFAKADGENAPWRGLIDSGLALAREARFGADRLPPDWLLVGGDGQIAPAPDKPPLFGFDAVRVPLYLAWGGETTLAQSLAGYWNKALSEGRRPAAWVNLSTGQTAEFTLSKGGVAIAALALNDTKEPRPVELAADRTYYASALGLLADLAARERDDKRLEP